MSKHWPLTWYCHFCQTYHIIWHGWFTSFEIFSREYRWCQLKLGTNIKHCFGLIWADRYTGYETHRCGLILSMIAGNLYRIKHGRPDRIEMPDRNAEPKCRTGPDFGSRFHHTNFVTGPYKISDLKSWARTRPIWTDRLVQKRNS